MPERQTERIRELNDRCRATGDASLGTWVITPGVESQGTAFVIRAIHAVFGFNDFTPDNDPHEEHDFGIMKLDAHTLYWKIDYYDLAYKFGSEDPADPEKTRRVLTIMLASEY